MVPVTEARELTKTIYIKKDVRKFIMAKIKEAIISSASVEKVYKIWNVCHKESKW